MAGLINQLNADLDGKSNYLCADPDQAPQINAELDLSKFGQIAIFY